MVESTKEVHTQSESISSVEHLIGREPDSERDRDALRRAADGGPTAGRLARRLHADETWRQTPLRGLLVGLGSIEVPPGAFPPDVGVRATNCLLRARITDWWTLASWTPADISALEGVGQRSLDEILRAALRYWAEFHLGDSPQPGAREIYNGLVALSAWGTATLGTQGAAAAIAAANETTAPLPPRVITALRALRQISGSADGSTFSQERAFSELEEAPGFAVFKRRRLEDQMRRPTLAELADELGVTRSRIGQSETNFERLLERKMREEDWPIRLTVEEMRQRLGAVARPGELDELFTALDCGRSLTGPSRQHRRALLLWLGGYRVENEWITGPDIESLTEVILAAAKGRERAGLDAATRQLSLLGVRDELQLAWILSRGNLRIIDEQLVST